VSDRNIGYPVIALYLAFWVCVGFGLLVLATSNVAPHPPTLVWKNDAPTTIHKIAPKIEKEAVDPDGDKISYIYEWTKNGETFMHTKDGEVVGEFRGTSIGTTNTARGDVFAVRVIADDGTYNGGFACSFPWRECAGESSTATLEVTVQNALPNARILIENDEPTSRDDVAAVVLGADSDGDEISFTAYWRKADEVIEDPAQAKYNTMEQNEEGRWVATLPSRATRRDQEWVLVVVPNDGNGDGETTEMSVTIY